ncbi:MAG: circadian clock protein KaiC [Euryarchaeota archaeon]|nr:circadian clock protein KaiC [Euryarchaeota archaeon]
MSPRAKDERAEAPQAGRGPRCRTGIEGLDKVLNGGIPVGNNVLLTGACGTGKTTLAAEFLASGASAGEPGLYLAVTEQSQKVLDNLSGYEFFDGKLVDEKKLSFVDLHAVLEKLQLDKVEYSHSDVPGLIGAVTDAVKQAGAKRVVIDSVTGVLLHLRTRELIRDFMSKLCRRLTEAGATTLLVSEIAPDEKRYSSFGVEEAVADGIVVLGNVEQRGYLLRTLHVVKMRGTPHSRSRYVIDLTPYGIIIVPLLRSSTGGPA